VSISSGPVLPNPGPVLRTFIPVILIGTRPDPLRIFIVVSAPG